MNEEERRLSEEAFEWVKKNERMLVEKFASLEEYEVDLAPVSLFMAGSPGAGKTEVSKRLLQRFDKKPVRIDADEIRVMCPGYRGGNSHVFQRAASRGVNMLYSHALYESLNLILDGTFAYRDVETNIRRSLDKQRKVEVYFVYQDPLVAWWFTKEREKSEGRRVPKAAFIDTFLRSRENVRAIKQMFGDRVELNLVVKDVEKGYEYPEPDVVDIDQHLPMIYTRSNLESILL